MKNLLIILLLFFALALTGYIIITQSNNENRSTSEVSNINTQASNNYPVSSVERVADKLEVYYFHRTARCYSCKTIGQYIRETMEQKYSEQIKNGIVDFREFNVELPENKEIAKKFRASGSSLFINRIIDGNDNIEQDTNVWRLLRNEIQFKSYLESKINSYLGI